MQTPTPQAEDVLRFWEEAGPTRWFRKDADFDADFKSRFESAHMAAARGELAHWAGDARGALALLILLDQFPRNAYRGTGHMFATDGLALAVASATVDRGMDQQVSEDLRLFFYLPFTHSEQLADQERCVRLVTPMGGDRLKFAHVHHEVIARFGRFPHRNTALGRSTTALEQAYLDGGGFAG